MPKPIVNSVTGKITPVKAPVPSSPFGITDPNPLGGTVPNPPDPRTKAMGNDSPYQKIVDQTYDDFAKWIQTGNPPDWAKAEYNTNFSTTNNNEYNFDALADAILGYGHSIADAQLRATNSANALQKEMWYQGEANTDRRLSDQYSFNAEQAQLNRDFQAQQSQAIMDWEAGLSNSAHQREVADLKAAGLNPVLSANAGASTPSVSTPSGSSASGSAISGNHFQGHQANIVGAYSAAGQFISEYLGLLQNDAHFNREMDLQESNAKWNHALGIINAITGGLTSALGLGIANKRSQSWDYRNTQQGWYYGTKADNNIAYRYDRYGY